MMYQDCRNDEYYNYDFLNAEDKQFVTGYDWCNEEVVDNFFNNLDVYFDTDSHLMHVLKEKLPEDMRGEETIEWTFGDKETSTRKIETYADLLRSTLLDWIESERDALITSMIDYMKDEEYKKNRDEAMKNNPDKYIDTRSFNMKKGEDYGR